MPAPGDQHNDGPNGIFRNPYLPATVDPPRSSYTAAQILTLQHQLNKCLGPEFVTQRPGAGGQKVSYVESFKAIQLANEIFGFNGWSSSIRAIQQDFAHEINGRWSMGISVTMRVTLQDGTYHEDIGYGSIENTKGLAGAYEKCKKEGTTDGLKRCLRNFGNVLGNCVYDKEYLARLKRVKENPVRWNPATLHRRPENLPQGQPRPTHFSQITSAPPPEVVEYFTVPPNHHPNFVPTNPTHPPTHAGAVPSHIQRTETHESKESDMYNDDELDDMDFDGIEAELMITEEEERFGVEMGGYDAVVLDEGDEGSGGYDGGNSGKGWTGGGNGVKVEKPMYAGSGAAGGGGYNGSGNGNGNGGGQNHAQGSAATLGQVPGFNVGNSRSGVGAPAPQPQAPALVQAPQWGNSRPETARGPSAPPAPAPAGNGNWSNTGNGNNGNGGNNRNNGNSGHNGGGNGGGNGGRNGGGNTMQRSNSMGMGPPAQPAPVPAPAAAPASPDSAIAPPIDFEQETPPDAIIAFMNARAATGQTTALFDPTKDSPLLKRTAGVEHAKSSPIRRDGKPVQPKTGNSVPQQPQFGGVPGGIGRRIGVPPSPLGGAGRGGGGGGGMGGFGRVKPFKMPTMNLGQAQGGGSLGGAGGAGEKRVFGDATGVNVNAGGGNMGGGGGPPSGGPGGTGPGMEGGDAKRTKM